LDPPWPLPDPLTGVGEVAEFLDGTWGGGRWVSRGREREREVRSPSARGREGERERGVWLPSARERGADME